MLNKKGNILDWFFILAVILLTAIVMICVKIVMDSVDDSEVFSENTQAQAIIDNTQGTLLNFDNLMLFVIIGLSTFVLVSSAVVYNHPAFFIAGLFLLFIAIVIAGSISNAFWVFTDSSTILATAAMYPKLTFIMNNLPLYILFMGMAAMITMYIGYRRE